MARRKIYDIKPPKASAKVENSIKEFLQQEPKKKTATASRRRKEKKSYKGIFVAGSAVVLLLLCVYLYFKLPKADVKIWPKVETLVYQQAVTADKSATSVDVSKFVIPAKYFETEKSSSEDFPATGNANNEGKATGTITIYNKYDPPSPLTLKIGTHFMSDSGKLFVTNQKVVVPAAKKSGSKITPGSVQVGVTAVEGGDSYNIAPSNFSVPGLKGTAYYYSISASSAKAMSGGYEGKVKKVTDDDLQGAKDALVNKLTTQATDELKGQISSEYVLLENAISAKTTSASSSTKVGTIAQNFTYQASVKASALAFKKSDLQDFAKQYIISQMQENKTLLEKSLKQEYSAATVDISGGKMGLNCEFSSGIYQSIDKNSLAVSLLNENSDQISQAVKNTLGENVSKVEINFWPFWVKKAPNSQKRINISLQFE